MRPFNLGILFRALKYLNAYGSSAGLFRSPKCSAINGAVLRFHHKQLPAFQMGHLGPVNRRGSIDVIEADIKYAGIEPFDLTGHAVAILHDQRVCLVPCKKRHGEKNNNESKRVGTVFHARTSLW